MSRRQDKNDLIIDVLFIRIFLSDEETTRFSITDISRDKEKLLSPGIFEEFFFSRSELRYMIKSFQNIVLDSQDRFIFALPVNV